MSVPTSVLLGLVSVAVLAALHLLAPKIRRLPFVPERVTASFAGGLAVSYVFLHLLPELAEGNQRLGEILGEGRSRTPLLGLEIFLVALIGFLFFYGMERLAERSQEVRSTPGDSGDARAGADEPEPGTGGAGVFRLHLGSFVLYNAIIAYTLPVNYRASIAFAVLFTVAMGLHFVLSDRGLEEHYGQRFDRWTPRLVLVGGLVVGWVLAALFAPTSTLAVSILTAFLAGSILLNVFKEEIPNSRRSNFGWFVTGLTVYALLLGLVTALDQDAAKRSEKAALVVGGGASAGAGASVNPVVATAP